MSELVDDYIKQMNERAAGAQGQARTAGGDYHVAGRDGQTNWGEVLRDGPRWHTPARVAAARDDRGRFARSDGDGAA
jgi:hypothetical protein